MKIIVCGAGAVGRSIVSYLTKGNNDITVIDNNPQRLDEISQEFEVLPILGSASYPSILEKAGAQKAQLLIAATNNDEVNLTACNVAHSLFEVQKKIARLNSSEFLNPLWANLYKDDHIPVDIIISPEEEIGKYIYNMLKIPGSMEVRNLLNNRLYLVAFKISAQSPFVQVPIMNLKQVDEDLDVEIVCIRRKNKVFIPYKGDIIEAKDEVYVLIPSEKINSTLAAFGAENSAIERLVVFGGNEISKCIARQCEQDDNIISCKIIEEEYAKANEVAKELNDTVVLQGQMMSDKILSEAGIYNADVSVAVTLKDEDNILSSLLARKCGVKNTLSLVNSPAYNNLIDIISENILVDRTSVTISKILHELRNKEIRRAYSLGRGFAELWEVQIAENSCLLGKNIKSLDLPASSKICAILRDENIIFPSETEEIKTNDTLLIYVFSESIKKVEKIFD